MKNKIYEAKKYVERIDRKVERETNTLKMCKTISYLLLISEIILVTLFTFLTFNTYVAPLVFAFIATTLLVINIIHALLVISELLRGKKGFPILKRIILKILKGKKYQELNQFLKDNSLKEGILRIIKEQPEELLAEPLYNELDLLKRIYGEETINLIIKKVTV